VQADHGLPLSSAGAYNFALAAEVRYSFRSGRVLGNTYA